MVPGDSVHGDGRAPVGRAARRLQTAGSADRAAAAAELLVVGLGPGPDDWLTPEVTAALAEVDHVVGYAPYVNRVPQRAGPDPARLRQHRRAGPGPARARPGPARASGSRSSPAATPGSSGWRRRSSRRPRTRRTPTSPIRVLPGRQRRPGRGRAGGRADRRRLRGAQPVRPAQAVVGDRAPAARDRRGRPGAGDLQPGVPLAAPSRSCAAQKLLLEHRSADTVVVVGRDVGRAEESLTVTTLAELDAGVDRHEVPADRRRVVDPGHRRRARSGRRASWTGRGTSAVVEVRLAAADGSSARPTRITAAWRSPAASTWSAMSATVPRSTSSSGLATRGRRRRPGSRRRSPPPARPSARGCG